MDEKNRVNEDAEQSMISKLKSECGSSFTTKLEQMFKDRRNSKKTNEEYNQVKQNNSSSSRDGNIKIDCKVLTAGQWPTEVTKIGKKVDKKDGADSNPYPYLPKEMQLAFDDYKRFYLNKHQGRKLTLLPTWGIVDVQFNFPNKNIKGKTKFTINTTTQFACLLAKFNEKPVWSLEELRSSMTDFPNLTVSLVVLTNPRNPVLKKVGDSSSESSSSKKDEKSKGMSSFQPTDKFTINEKFDSKIVKIRIMPTLNRKKGEDATQQKETRTKIEEDRRHEIEAAIVRIMKARKTLNHNNLIAETIEQLSKRFRAQPAVIKVKIEALIERDYIRRGDNREIYEYIA